MLWRLESHLTYKPSLTDFGGLVRDPPLTEAIITDDLHNKIHVVYRTADSSRVILFAHGRDGNVTKFGRHYSMFDGVGYSYMAFDYPGYGRSSGVPTEKTLNSAAAAVIQFATRIFGIRDESLVLFGLSLGGAIALELAQHCNPARIILESAFTSSRDMGRVMLGKYLPLFLLVPNRYRNVDKIQTVKSPLLLLHGTIDTRIPHSHSKVLYETGGGPRTFVSVEGAGHLDLIDKLGPAYSVMVREFIDTGSLRLPGGTESTTIINSA